MSLMVRCFERRLGSVHVMTAYPTLQLSAVVLITSVSPGLTLTIRFVTAALPAADRMPASRTAMMIFFTRTPFVPCRFENVDACGRLRVCVL